MTAFTETEHMWFLSFQKPKGGHQITLSTSSFSLFNIPSQKSNIYSPHTSVCVFNHPRVSSYGCMLAMRTKRILHPAAVTADSKFHKSIKLELKIICLMKLEICGEVRCLPGKKREKKQLLFVLVTRMIDTQKAESTL